MLILELSALPPVEFSPNWRGHWGTKYHAGVQAKSDILALVREQGWRGPALDGATVTVTWYVPDRREYDKDNLVGRTKPVIDGLVDAGVLVGDSTKHANVVYEDPVHRPRCPGTRIEVTEG